MALRLVGCTALLWCSACVVVHCNKCAMDMTQECMQSLLVVTSYKKPMLARYKEELDEICHVLSRDLKCVDDFIRSCFSAEQKKALGDLIDKSLELIRDLCEEGPYKTEYLHHAECFRRIYDEDHCNESYYQMINMSTLPSQQVPLRKYCCAYTRFMQCSVTTAREICNEETAKFIEKYLRRTGDPLVRGQCNMNSYTSTECSSSLRAIPSGISLLFSLLSLGLLLGVSFYRHP